MPTNRTVFHWKPLGRSSLSVGLYRWERVGGVRYAHGYQTLKRGYVLRLGPLGHVQAQRYRMESVDGRVPRSSVMVSWWGVRGRRRKRYVELSVGR